MKLKNILQEGAAQETSNEMVYSMVLRNIKTDNYTKSDIKNKMFNDQFWVSDLDEVTKALNKNVDKSFDAIFTAAESIVDAIRDHYEDPYNHAPGYKKPKIDFNLDDISHNEAVDIVKKSAPNMYAAYLAKEAELKKANEANKKILEKTLSSKLPHLSKIVISNYDIGWGDYLKFLKANPTDREVKSLVSELNLDLSKLKTGLELAAAVEKGCSDSTWMYDTYRVVGDTDVLDIDDYQSLSAVHRSPTLSKKLWTLVAPSVSKK